MTEIKTEGFGASLRRRREELGLSLDDVAASTRIRKTYLHALEEENLQALPGSTYVIGFLRIYAQQLGLPIDTQMTALTGVDERPQGPVGPSTENRSYRQLKAVERARGYGWRILVLCLLLGACAAVFAYIWYNRHVPDLPPADVVKPQQSTAAPSGNPAPPDSQPAVPVPLDSQPAVPVPLTAANPEPQPTRTETASEQNQVTPVDLAVIPPGGAIVRMQALGSGVAKISLDRQEEREYELRPDQTLHWKVTLSLAVQCSTPGLVRLWIGDQEIPVSEFPAFTLSTSPGGAARP